jgi:hypothetical protein
MSVLTLGYVLASWRRMFYEQYYNAGISCKKLMLFLI